MINRLTVVCVAAFLLASCSSGPEKAPVLAVAYAGPEEVILHADIDSRSAPTGAARHGDRLEIIGQRRRWFKVRNERGLEGWADDRQLLDPAQMDRLRDLAKQAAAAPAQAVATTFDTLNVHTEPNRQAPSFIRLKAGEKFDVLQHRVMVKGPLARRKLIPPAPKATPPARKKKKDEKEPPVPLPPAPAAPAPPSDWLELSRGRAAKLEPEAAVAPPRDDWTLIRTSAGLTGWVLTNRVYMNIPDEVAQYAEGHRIMSYTAIGSILDKGESRPVWLWTTAEALGRDYDFDGYRVFTWSVKRHRYETAFIQRRERGYFPVIAKNGEFSVCVEDKTGRRVRRRYSLSDTRVRAAGAEPCDAVNDTEMPAVEPKPLAPVPGGETAPGIVSRITSTVKGWFGRK